jgi:hypothetical protein
MPQHTTEQKKRFAAMKEFAAAVDLKLQAEKQDDGSTDYVLYSTYDGRKGDALVTEFDMHDMVDSIHVYAGSHINYQQALENFNDRTREDN